MTDEELIARLGEIQGQAGLFASAAAARIEQLVATNEALTKERDQWISHAKTAIWSDSEELKETERKLAKAVEALQSVMEACDQVRMIPRSGAGGMTIEANVKGSIYVGVPAWPIEEARTTLAEIKGESHE